MRLFILQYYHIKTGLVGIYFLYSNESGHMAALQRRINFQIKFFTQTFTINHANNATGGASVIQ